MVTHVDVDKVIQSGQLATVVYKGEARTINPVEIMETAAGKKVLVAQEEGKGWRRYSIERITELTCI